MIVNTSKYDLSEVLWQGNTLPDSCEICGKIFWATWFKIKENPCIIRKPNMELKTENGSDETKTTEILTDEEIGIENVVNDLDNFVNDKIKIE